MTDFWTGFICGVAVVYGLAFIGAGVFYFIDMGRNLDDKTIQESNTERQDTYSTD